MEVHHFLTTSTAVLVAIVAAALALKAIFANRASHRACLEAQREVRAFRSALANLRSEVLKDFLPDEKILSKTAIDILDEVLLNVDRESVSKFYPRDVDERNRNEVLRRSRDRLLPEDNNEKVVL